ncbi:serine/threonine-protein kinase [Actinorugispora endophytica]|uniref:non-specific serine/threonine protein kinase n=1 Tax=Actinorugispora endophytica TaxID=1605990 RepID=A0A4R6UT12_9ACTN|nr:serine/threonine-protein kinase [Actinorugispora endophytica]TDQ48823.1 protein kinase-like protein [Actinorugispora endophytica]
MSPRILADRYRLVEPIGHGGMGTVWRAEDEVLSRDVAIKEVRVSPALEPGTRAELLRRTMREARICAGLNHPSIVTVHDVVRENDRPWIVMELLRGRSLEQVVREEGALPPRRVAEIGRQLLSALRTAHAAGVLHRDVKPANVLLLPDGRPVLTDFGIAVSDSEERLTLTGKLPGSPGYMAPERVSDGTVTAASDQWSLGATLYYAVEGRSAYERPSDAERLTAVLDDYPDPAQRAGALRPVLNGMLQRDPGQRLTGPALDAALASVIAGTRPGDGTPTRLDVSALVPPRTALPPGPRITMGAMGAGTPSAPRAGGFRWWKIALPLLAGVVTLILAPLLVEWLAAVLFP